MGSPNLYLPDASLFPHLLCETDWVDGHQAQK